MIEQKYQNAVLQHKYSGRDWAVVQDLSTDYCRVVPVGKQDVGRRAFVAHKEMLTPQFKWVLHKDGIMRLSETERESLTPQAQLDLDEVRRAVEAGDAVIVASHIRPA